MANYVENRISFYGNKEVHALTAEVNKRLKESADVAYVFYGTIFADDAETIKKLGSMWVIDADGDFGDDIEICLKSFHNAPEQLENHIVWFYSKIDPNVVMCNHYSNLNGLFIGARYKFVSKSKIMTFHEHMDIEESVVDEEDLDDIEDGDEAEYITWQTLSERHVELNDLAKKQLIASHPDKKRYLRWQLSNLRGTSLDSQHFE